MEKKYTRPSSRTGRIADISQDSMFTQQMDRSYSLPSLAARAASMTSTGLVQSATITSVYTPSSIRPGTCLGLRTTPTTLPLGPTFFIASQPHRTPDLPLAPRIRTLSPSWGSLRACAGAPATSRAARARGSDISSGILAYRADSNRMALPTMSTRSISLWMARIFSIFSGVMDRETRETILSPSFRSKPGFFFRSSPM